MATRGEVEEDQKEEAMMNCNEEREEESKDGITCEDVKVRRKEKTVDITRFDRKERKVGKKKKKEKDDLFVGHENGVEVKKMKRKKKKKQKDDVVVAGTEGKKVEREKLKMRNDRKAHNKEKRRKRKVKEIKDVVVTENMEAKLDTREKMKSGKDVMEDEANCEVLKPKKRNRASAADSSKLVTPECNKSKRVRFSDEVKVFSPSDSPQSSNENKGGLVQGKRFSKEEDELLKKAVDKYLKAMKLSEEGLDMILYCKSHPLVKDCWKVICNALPWRPYTSVYQRARRLYLRGESKWTSEEVELLRESYKKYGPKWKRIADKLGKNKDHVRNAFHRYGLVDLKKGKWSQDEYGTLFELVNEDLLMKVSEEKKSKYGMLRDNIHWEAISDRLGTRNTTTCFDKWYNQLTSPMVAQREWADVDDYKLLFALVDLDASCEDEVDWDSLLQHRSGDLCRKRWLQMARHLGEHGNKSFSEQVEVVSKRYCPDFAQVREALDARPVD